MGKVITIDEKYADISKSVASLTLIPISFESAYVSLVPCQLQVPKLTLANLNVVFVTSLQETGPKQATENMFKKSCACWFSSVEDDLDIKKIKQKRLFWFYANI